MLLHDRSRALARLQNVLVFEQLCFDVEEEADYVFAPVTGSRDIVVLPDRSNVGYEKFRRVGIVLLQGGERVEDKRCFA